MKLRKNGGKVIFQPLDKMFSMGELFGSPSQRYDAATGHYNADRTLTPYTLQPQLSLSDPAGAMASGDYTADLVNVTWTIEATVKGAAPVRGTHYTIDDTTHALTVMFNLDPDTKGSISFYAEYVDPRRKDVLRCEWSQELACVSETDWRVRLDSWWPMQTDLKPWKDRGVFPIPVQLYNGDTPMESEYAVYDWQVFKSGTWRDINRNLDFWCRGGEKTSTLQVEQKYIQRILIRCLAWPKGQTSELQVMAFKLRRHYGQYDDDIEVLEGQYIFPETTRAVAEVYIEKHSGGRLPSPERFFDMEIFYSRGDGILWHVAHGPRGEVTRSMFPVDATMQHMFAALIREKTALLPISLGGKLLAVEGKIVFATKPLHNREIED